VRYGAAAASVRRSKLNRSEGEPMLDEIFNRALAAFPDVADTVTRIRDVRREAFSRTYEEFFEPKSAFDL
jgi:hypothetical protein